jgi:hypothetical protein
VTILVFFSCHFLYPFSCFGHSLPLLVFSHSVFDAVYAALWGFLGFGFGIFFVCAFGWVGDFVAVVVGVLCSGDSSFGGEDDGGGDLVGVLADYIDGGGVVFAHGVCLCDCVSDGDFCGSGRLFGEGCVWGSFGCCGF